jgi:hypothetical protein
MNKNKDQIILEGLYSSINESAHKTEDQDARDAYPEKDDKEEAECDCGGTCDECKEDKEEKKESYTLTDLYTKYILEKQRWTKASPFKICSKVKDKKKRSKCAEDVKEKHKED